MRIYTESDEEIIRARDLLNHWTGDGLLSKEQHEHLKQDLVTDLRTTNIFLRVVLFFFTILGVAAAIELFFAIFLSRPSEQTTGIFFLIFAAITYTAAEMAVAQAHLYRYGIEEALAICSVALLCTGIELSCFSDLLHVSYGPHFVVLAALAGAFLWVWYRFNLWYAFPAAMISVVFVPAYWTSSQPARHLIVAALYVAGLIGIATVRSSHRFDYLEEAYSISEACLWFGLYLSVNLKIAEFNLPSLIGAPMRFIAQSPSPSYLAFYWTTWVLIWCLPLLILARGIRQKDRLILAAGAVTALITLITNKPYLGWQRHTWDPILLGITLAGVALFLRSWLAQAPGGVRHGFTAASLSGKDKHTLGIGSAVLGLVTPQSITPAPQPTNPDFQFGGGGSGGGGVSGDF